MAELALTRRSLHAIAELLLSGPQHATHGTIKLVVTPEGFGTIRDPQVEVVGSRLRVEGREVALDGRTILEVATDAGLQPHNLEDVYTDGCGLDATHLLVVDEAAAAELHHAFQRGAEALAAFAPEQDPVLWPEHFDLGITVDEVNYGISAGDSFLEVPYAYVGPWSRDGLTDPFWNAPFGAALPLDAIDDLNEFFSRGADLLSAG